MQQKLRDALKCTAGRSLRAVIGFDGFVDEIVYAVDKRYSPTAYDRIPTLKAYGQRIAAASGLSTNIEIVSTYQKIGGNGPIFALGLKQFGCKITYIGCTGKENVHGVFADLAQGERMIGICDPGQTDAMEFNDGKLIRSKLDSLAQLTWENICKKISANALASLLDEAELISFNNWTMLPNMSDIWRHLLQDTMPCMKASKAEKILFFDLADPEKRSDDDVQEALSLIRQFKGLGFQVVLGLNKKEACEIARLCGKLHPQFADANLRELTEYIAAFLEIDCVAVHPIDRAACVRQGRYTEINGPYCERPRLTTGAGDHFNAGFMYGYAMGLETELCLLLGTAISGYYVRECKSPTIPELSAFLDRWYRGKLDDGGEC